MADLLLPWYQSVKIYTQSKKCINNTEKWDYTFIHEIVYAVFESSKFGSLNPERMEGREKLILMKTFFSLLSQTYKWKIATKVTYHVLVPVTHTKSSMFQVTVLNSRWIESAVPYVEFLLCKGRVMSKMECFLVNLCFKSSINNSSIFWWRRFSLFRWQL